MSRLRPSPALVVAIVALVVALGGTGYAAIKLPANSVGAKQLKKGAVERAKIKNGAIDASKLAPDSVSGASINESLLGKVPSAAAADNATHATSVAGLDKITYKSVVGTTPIAPSGSVAIGTLDVNCDTGQHPVGAGLHLSDPSQAIIDGQVNPSGYEFRVLNFDSSAPHTFNATVICVTAATVG
jgi:hypothetical protein